MHCLKLQVLLSDSFVSMNLTEKQMISRAGSISRINKHIKISNLANFHACITKYTIFPLSALLN